MQYNSNIFSKSFSF